MSNLSSRARLYQQLAVDLACSVEELKSRENIFKVSGRTAGMRRCETLLRTQLHLICINGKMAARSENEELIGWLQNSYRDFPAQWLSEYFTLRELDKGLAQFGIGIYDFRPYSIPYDGFREESALNVLDSYEVIWYNQEELLRFKGDQRFREALVFEPNAPDMLAVTASLHGEICAMAAANADADTMWQMGINVLEGNEGKGLGTALVMLCKNEIMRRGVLPYYGTAMSHVTSRITAQKAGFIPAFTELVTTSLK